MNKRKLIDKIAKKAEVSKKNAQTVIDTTIEAIMEVVKKGDKVVLVGFGSFSSVKRAARNGRNPQTGKTIKIPARKAPKFSAGKSFKDKVK
ncbi:MAG: HU family DNA-binding protein [Deferribacteraceae bacterium]|jgi:DNA-binding protein HU-beta|nr:HU family DNA-binding protein [Deferribacteraceae bacterium]